MQHYNDKLDDFELAKSTIKKAYTLIGSPSPFNKTVSRGLLKAIARIKDPDYVTNSPPSYVPIIIANAVIMAQH